MLLESHHLKCSPRLLCQHPPPGLHLPLSLPTTLPLRAHPHLPLPLTTMLPSIFVVDRYTYLLPIYSGYT